MRSSVARSVAGLTLVTGLFTAAITAVHMVVLPATNAIAQATLSSAVGVRTKVFVDRSRNTPPDSVAGIPPDDQRRLPTTIFYPARGTPTRDGSAVENAKPRAGRFPLVIFNGGSPGSPEDYAPLLAEWAAAGYVVAAPEFPISSLAGPDDVAWKDLPRQSDDARFVLDRVLELDANKTGIAEIDDGRIAVAGHSFGGATALSLVASCCRDRRFDAAVVLAGVGETTDGPKLKGINGPVLFVHARGDRAVPYGPALAACAATKGWRRMLTIEQLRGLRAHVDPYVGDIAKSDYAGLARPAMINFLDGYVRDRGTARSKLASVGDSTDIGSLDRCAGAAAESTTTTRPIG